MQQFVLAHSLFTAIMYRATKRQRLEHPTSWMDCDSIETVVAAPSISRSFVTTPLASEITKEIFFERFKKEILTRFGFSLSSQIMILNDEPLENAKERRNLLKQRMQVGINSCTRALEAAVYGKAPAPLLLVLNSDVHPTAVTSHLPILAQQSRVPVLLLPGNSSSSELGNILGTKKIAALAFVPHVSVYQESEEAKRVHTAVDSFVDFVRGKISKGAC